MWYNYSLCIICNTRRNPREPASKAPLDSWWKSRTEKCFKINQCKHSPVIHSILVLSPAPCARRNSLHPLTLDPCYFYRRVLFPLRTGIVSSTQILWPIVWKLVTDHTLVSFTSRTCFIYVRLISSTCIETRSISLLYFQNIYINLLKILKKPHAVNG